MGEQIPDGPAVQLRRAARHQRRCAARLVRGSSVHVFNNYYEDVVDTGINSRVGACVRIEQNYFSNVMDPWVSAFSGATGLGGAELICNTLAEGTKTVLNPSSEIFANQETTETPSPERRNSTRGAWGFSSLRQPATTCASLLRRPRPRPRTHRPSGCCPCR